MVILILLAGFRPASSVTIRPTGLLVPLYTPAGDATWSTLIQVKGLYPSVPIIAIINPQNGPGSSSNAAFVSGIQSLQTAGINVVGYVPTNYALTSISVVETGISNYSIFYHVNGIFFDQMNSSQAAVSYYSALSTYVHSLGLAITIGNPGTSVPASFIGTMNILNIYENSGDPSVSTISSATIGYDRSNFAMIAYNVAAPTQSYLDSVAPYVSYVYFTDGNSPNPFAGLTSYLNTLALELLSIDGPVTSTNNLAGGITLGNNDSTLTFNIGVSHITISLNLGHASTWTAPQYFDTAYEGLDANAILFPNNNKAPSNLNSGTTTGIGTGNGFYMIFNSAPHTSTTPLSYLWLVNGSGIFQSTSTALTSSNDNSFNLGSSSLRFANTISNLFSVYHASGDSNPTSQLGDGFLKFGAGGSSALSYRIDLCGTSICFDATPLFSPTVFKLSTTGIGNTQGFQSVIAQALTNGGTTTTVSLPVSEPDTAYAVSCTTNANLGAVWVTGKATNQFFLNTNTAAGPSSTADCIITHH